MPANGILFDIIIEAFIQIKMGIIPSSKSVIIGIYVDSPAAIYIAFSLPKFRITVNNRLTRPQ